MNQFKPDGVYSRQYCHIGFWASCLGPLHQGLTSASRPSLLPLIPFTTEALTSLHSAAAAIKTNIPEVFVDGVKDFWEQTIKLQDSIVAGTYVDSREPQFPTILPRSVDNDPVERAGILTPTMLATLPQHLVQRVLPPERALYVGNARTRGEQEATNYIRGETNSGQAVPDYDVTYDNMKTGGMAVFLAEEEDEDRAKKLYFRVKTKGGTLSPPLVLCEMLRVANAQRRQLEWLAYGVKKYSGKGASTFVGQKLASNRAFFKPTGRDGAKWKHINAPWEKSAKPLLAWDVNYLEAKTSIPKEQYKQLVTLLLARESDIVQEGNEEEEIESDLERDNTETDEE